MAADRPRSGRVLVSPHSLAGGARTLGVGPQRGSGLKGWGSRVGAQGSGLRGRCSMLRRQASSLRPAARKGRAQGSGLKVGAKCSGVRPPGSGPGPATVEAQALSRPAGPYCRRSVKAKALRSALGLGNRSSVPSLHSSTVGPRTCQARSHTDRYHRAAAPRHFPQVVAPREAAQSIVPPTPLGRHNRPRSLRPGRPSASTRTRLEPAPQLPRST